jgi:hypothetical protein
VIALRSLFVLALVPLALGVVVVTYQDAVMTHLPARMAMAAQMKAGEIPFLHPYQSCGQPLAGNPNFGTFFPDTILFLLLPPGAAFGMRFALAAVLAFVGARRWARAEGASPPAAEVAGYAFALSGVFVSAWRFYNTGLALALAPFVLAAVAGACRPSAPGRGLRRAMAGIASWSALELLAGEPVVALLTAVAVAVRFTAHAVGDDGGDHPAPARRAGAILAAAALALLIAAPQIAATWQSFRGSTRDVAPFSFAVATGTSVHAARILEQVAPFPFGRPDLTGPFGFHGHRFYDNHAPYLWTLHIGWATLALLLRHGRPLARGERAWWIAAAAGVVLSLGHHLPSARVLSEVLSLGGRVRFPVKWWYLVALCLVVPVARAATRLYEGGGWDRRRAAVAALIAAAALAALPAIDLRTPLAMVTVAVSLGAAAVVSVMTGRQPALLSWTVAGSLAIAHLPLVLAFVDRMPPPPPPLAGGRVYERLTADAHPVGGGGAPGTTRDFFRRATAELWAVAGGTFGIGYAFDRDPDGSYFDGDRVARKAVDDLPWPERAPALRRAGVRYVVTGESLAAPYRRVRTQGSAILYELDSPADPVRIESTAASEGPGRVVGARESVSRMEATIEAGTPVMLVWSRTFFPAWRASVDGAPAPVVVASGHLVGVPVPPGAHRVEVWWPRGPLVAGLVLAVLGLLITALLARR